MADILFLTGRRELKECLDSLERLRFCVADTGDEELDATLDELVKQLNGNDEEAQDAAVDKFFRIAREGNYDVALKALEGFHDAFCKFGDWIAKETVLLEKHMKN